MRKLALLLALFLLMPLAKADTYLTDCAGLTTEGETYYLTQDIIDSTAGICMYITASDVILDCQGHIIDGVDGGTGIRIESLATVRNCIITDWSKAIQSVMDFNAQNLTIVSNGIGIECVCSLNAQDLIVMSNDVGVYFTRPAIIINSFFDNNWDINYVATSCDSYFENVTGRDNKPILFLNYTVEIRNWKNNVSTIILCGANNSIIDNLEISPSRKSGGSVQIISSNNVTFSNSILKNIERIFIRYSSNSRIYNISEVGVTLSFSNYNILDNIRVKGSDSGFALGYSNYNNITNSVAENCTYGVYLISASSNLLYNNLFNSTNNFYFYETTFPNYWNTTRQPGTRIYSPGNEIGGNYWTNPEGNGYSDTCTDADRDGFCDDPYVLATDNVDYLALSDEYLPTPLPPVHGIPLISRSLVGLVVGFGILAFMLRTLFDIKEPKKIIEYFITLAIIVLSIISLIVLFA